MLTSVLFTVSLVESVEAQHKSRGSRLTQFVDSVGVQDLAGRESPSDVLASSAESLFSDFPPFLDRSPTWSGFGLIG